MYGIPLNSNRNSIDSVGPLKVINRDSSTPHFLISYPSFREASDSRTPHFLISYPSFREAFMQTMLALWREGLPFPRAPILRNPLKSMAGRG